MSEDRDTITVWPGKKGWDLIDELEETANESDESRNKLILDAIALYLEVHDLLEKTEVWQAASQRDRRMMLRQAIIDYRDQWE